MSHITAEVTGVAGATIQGRLIPSAESIPAHAVAVLLDGASAGIIRAITGANGAIAFSFTVPNHIVCAQFELVDPQNGRLLLAAPLDVRPQFALNMTRFEMFGLVVRGAFTVAVERDPALFVQFLANDVVLGGCFANLVEKAATPRLSPRGAKAAPMPTYEFTWTLASLCPLDQTYPLKLRIAGQDLRDGPEITIDARTLGVAGYVDKADGDVISGWVVDLAQPKRRINVDLWRDGVLVETRRADQARKDIAAFGLGDGYSAFRFKVPEVPLGGTPVPHWVRLSGTTTHLSNSPVLLEPAVRLLGYFDDISSGLISGWVVNLDEPETSVDVDVVCEGQVIAGGTANVSRQDVVRAGISNAQCGFRINLGPALLRTYLGRQVEVRVRGTTRIIDGSPKELTENPNIARFLERGKTVE